MIVEFMGGFDFWRDRMDFEWIINGLKKKIRGRKKFVFMIVDEGI